MMLFKVNYHPSLITSLPLLTLHSFALHVLVKAETAIAIVADMAITAISGIKNSGTSNAAEAEAVVMIAMIEIETEAAGSLRRNVIDQG